MSSNVVPIRRLFRRSWDWSSQELAEFYRVEAALVQAGLKVDTERGLSDEGDPWFTFCRHEDGEVIVHIARIDGEYILAGSAYDGIAHGRDVGALVRDLVARHPLVQMPSGKGGRPGSNIFLHPAALLIAIVATAFFKNGEARAMAADDHDAAQGHPAPGRGGSIPILNSANAAGEAHTSVTMDAAQSAVIMAAVASILQSIPLASESSMPADKVAAHSDDLASAPMPATQTANLSHTLLLSDSGGDTPHGGASSSALSASTFGTEVAKTLPLIAVLWDLSSPPSAQKLVSEEHSAAPVATGDLSATPLGPAAHPMLVINLAPAEGSSGGLPVVQAAKVNSTSADGSVQTHEVQHLDQLPAALTAVLQSAAHTSVDGEPVGHQSNETFADTLATFASHPATANPATANPATANPATPDHGSTPDAQPATPTGPPTTSTSTTTTSPDYATTAGGTDVSQSELQTILQNFLASTPNYSIVEAGQRTVVIYDVHALTSDVAVTTVTFDFSDGSTLSLVGLPAAMPPHSPHVA
jgi:hypothetical protein